MISILRRLKDTDHSYISLITLYKNDDTWPMFTIAVKQTVQGTLGTGCTMYY